MTNTAGTYRSFEDRTSVALLEAEGEILNFVLAQEMGKRPCTARLAGYATSFVECRNYRQTSMIRFV